VLKLGRSAPKGRKMADEKLVVFPKEYDKKVGPLFLCHGTDRHEIPAKKRQSVCAIEP